MAFPVGSVSRYKIHYVSSCGTLIGSRCGQCSESNIPVIVNGLCSCDIAHQL